MSTLEGALSNKLASLTPDERKQYGSVNEQNKRVVNKVNDYYNSQPDLSSRQVDWEEFQADYDSRAVLENTIYRLQSLITGLHSAKILHDWDNFQDSLRDYDYAKYMMKINQPGYETKVNEIGQFFSQPNPVPPPLRKNKGPNPH
ncbi:MAG: hypothetical protein WCY25_07830 [Moheibacter sp.]